ncbi:hypothetical protein [Archangium lipolyticum]|uniref:hypothetical protein n=1 Tax=Archangium lipolyticum TaxID=2970465 RepID=UPI00214A5197|nr:hypothetical protein [Archangium lipolyticum]
MLPLQRWLPPDEAAAWLSPYQRFFRSRGARLGMDVDAQVLSSGFSRGGAGLFSGGRFASLALENPRGTTFVDGDLLVDGWLENVGGLVFVRGNLIAQTLFTSGYLVVLGELRVRRLLGDDEPHGTYVFGDAHVQSAVFSHNHHFDVWGRAELGEEIHDESHGRTAMRERLVAWKVLSDKNQEKYLEEARLGLRAQAGTWGPLPEDWAARRYTPKPEAGGARPPPPPRSALVVELEQWLGSEGATQRQQLEGLRTHWLSRLNGAADREQARHLIRKAINSKKLVAERDALLRELE